MAAMDVMQHIAVLTGDLVASTSLSNSSVEQALDALKSCAHEQRGWTGTDLNFTRHRGDGWQVALSEPRYALRSALTYRATLRALGDPFDTSIGIATGPIDGELGENLNRRFDPVFIASGRALDNLKAQSPTNQRIAFPEKSALSLLADHFVSGWTTVQAQAALWFLPPGADPSYTDMAEHMGKSRQAVTKSVEASRVRLLVRALNDEEERSRLD